MSNFDGQFREVSPLIADWKMTVATSVYPPSLHRHDADGKAIDLEYFNFCKKSWRSASFEWLSVNRPDELPLVETFAPDIARIPFDDAQAIAPGRYGPTLGALFDATAPSPIAGICNADTYVLPGENTAKAIAEAARGHFIIARRTEVSDVAGAFHSVNWTGVDAIFFDRQAFEPILKHPTILRFQMGMPWWDVLLPVIASFQGPLLQIREPWLMHLRHPQAWKRDQYRGFGKQARDLVIGYADELSSRNERAREFMKRYRSTMAAYGAISLRKQLSVFSQVCRAWLWNETHPKILEVPGTTFDPIFRKSLDATLFRRRDSDSRMGELQKNAGLKAILNGMMHDQKLLLKLAGRHIKDWARSR